MGGAISRRGAVTSAAAKSEGELSAHGARLLGRYSGAAAQPAPLTPYLE